MAITKITSSVVANNAIIAAGVAENAITSSEIASNAVGTAQIASGSITTDMLDTNIDIAGTLDVTGVLTADSNVVIAGNLTVNGTTVTNSATNTTIEDALIELGTGTTGSPANDAGIVIERGDSDNAFIGWDESADTFILGTGSFTGASTGDLTISTAPLTIGALTASNLAYPTSDGTANQVLITNGSGTLSFSNLPIDGAVVDNYTATGDGSTVTFDTGLNPQDEKNTWVFVGGVYQPKSSYSYNGTQITFSEAPPNGEDIDIVSGQVAGFDSAETVLGIYTTTTTATDTYDTGLSAANENNTFVFIEGVYQPKSTYTWSGSTITFDANTPADLALEVMATKTLSASAVTTNTIAANAVTSAKIASNAILARHIAGNAIGASEIASNAQIVASTFTGALTGNVTGNVTGNLNGLSYPSSDGTNGQVLTTNGSGTLSFSTISGYTDSDVETYLDSGTSSPTFSTATVSGTFTVNTDADSTLTIADGGNDAVTLYGGTGDELYIGANNAYKLRFKTDGNIVMDNGGNLGIGTSSPTTWVGELLQTGSKSLYGQLDVNGAAYVANNVAYDGSNWKYVTSDTGSLYAQDPTSSNSHIWYTVADGTAGATATLSERMRIDGSGYIGINNTVASTVSGGYTNLVVGSGSASDSGISIYNNTSGTGRIHFADGTTTGDRYDGFIAYKHTDRELLIGAGTGGGTVAFFSQHGFHPNPSDSGSAAAANALDDYEEGTWIPTINGVSGGSGQTYSVQTGKYLKIGDLVVLSFEVTFSNKGSMIGLPVIGGIPYYSGTTGSINRAMNLVWGNLAFSPYSIGYLPRGGGFAQFYLYKLTAAGNLSLFAGDSDFNNNSTIAGTITYRVSV